MEPEQLQNFNERLSQWVSNQGFWFQVRYSMSGSGAKGRILFHLLKMSFRVLIFLVLVAIGTWIFLEKRTDSMRFVAIQKKEIQERLSASDFEMRGYRRTQGQLEISRLAAEGEKNTFFTTLEARNIRCNMGLVDGLLGVWKPGIISIAKLDIDLRAGADDPDAASNLAAALFRTSTKVEANSFEVGNTNMRWGFSERTQGTIVGSTMRLNRYGDGWKISLKGGTFSQNWLQNLEILNIEAVCDKDTLVFQKAELKLNQGTVDFSGLRLTGGERPGVSGIAKIRNLNLESIIPPALQSFMEGSISGDFKVTGSTNSSDGVGLEGQVALDGKDFISLRERIHLLKALSVVDYSRNYHRVDFREGSFLIKTINGGMEVSDVKLKSDELFTMEGRLKVRLPTQEEIQSAIAKGAGVDNSPLFTAEDAAAVERNLLKSESDFTLKRAALEAQRIKEGKQSLDSLSLFDRLGVGTEKRRMEQMEMERMSRMLRYDGLFLITIQKDAFERAPRLQEMYPVDPGSNRIPIRVPIEGDIYDITLKQAEDTYIRGQR
jgi:hypothetical protein